MKRTIPITIILLTLAVLTTTIIGCKTGETKNHPSTTKDYPAAPKDHPAH